jgi:hypothetical protein
VLTILSCRGHDRTNAEDWTIESGEKRRRISYERNNVGGCKGEIVTVLHFHGRGTISTLSRSHLGIDINLV